MRVRLVPLEGGTPIDVTKELILVGRKEDCDVRIDHKSISKLHCVVVKTDGLLLLRDLGSTNGTRVNGQRVRRAALLPNDLVSFASFKFKIAFGPDDPGVAPAAQHTQHLEPKDVAALMAKAPGAKGEPSSKELPAMPVQINPLPDVYPDDGRPR